MPFVYHIVITSEKWMESEVRVSVDVGVLPLNIRNKFNRSLFSLIIRLANYNITTSLIYKSDIGDAQI